MFQEVIVRHLNHSFAHFLMFTDLVLLARVTGHVTYQTTEGVMEKPIGVSPCVKIMEMLHELLLDLNKTK